MTKVDEMISRLHNVKPRGKRAWLASCPAHEDRDPSLAITEADDGRILLKCFAGCTALDVIHSLGMEVKDLFPQHGLNPYGTMRKLEYEYNKKQHGMTRERAESVMLCFEGMVERGEKLSDEDKKLAVEAYKILKG